MQRAAQAAAPWACGSGRLWGRVPVIDRCLRRHQQPLSSWVAAQRACDEPERWAAPGKLIGERWCDLRSPGFVWMPHRVVWKQRLSKAPLSTLFQALLRPCAAPRHRSACYCCARLAHCPLPRRHLAAARRRRSHGESPSPHPSLPPEPPEEHLRLVELEAAVLTDVEAYGRCPLSDKVSSV